MMMHAQQIQMQQRERAPLMHSMAAVHGGQPMGGFVMARSAVPGSMAMQGSLQAPEGMLQPQVCLCTSMLSQRGIQGYTRDCRVYRGYYTGYYTGGDVTTAGVTRPCNPCAPCIPPVHPAHPGIPCIPPVHPPLYSIPPCHHLTVAVLAVAVRLPGCGRERDARHEPGPAEARPPHARAAAGRPASAPAGGPERGTHPHAGTPCDAPAPHLHYEWIFIVFLATYQIFEGAERDAASSSARSGARQGPTLPSQWGTRRRRRR